MNPKTPLISALRDASPFFPLWPRSKGPLFRLEESWTFAFWAGEDYIILTIPAGYEFDKASIPSFFWGFPFNYTPDGLCTVPALEHDFLCDLASGGSEWLRERLWPLPSITSYTDVHKHLHRRLIEYGVRASKATAMWEAVRKFGPGSWVRPSTWNRNAST